MNQRLSSDKKQVADVVARSNVHDVAGLLQSYATSVLRVEAVDREVAEVARGIADASNGELQVSRAAMIQYLAYELKRALLRPGRGYGKIIRDREATALLIRPYISESTHKELTD